MNPRVARLSPSRPGAAREVADRYGACSRDVIERWEEDLGRDGGRSAALPDRLPDPDAEAIRRVLYGPDSPCEVPDEAIVNVE